MDYEVIASGSKGNATLLNGNILIDCGVPFWAVKPYLYSLNLVLLTHWHGDHFNAATVRRLAKERPLLRFGCCDWMASRLVDCGVQKTNIDIYSVDKQYVYNGFTVCPVWLPHDVPNCGYKVHFADGGKMVYCTDCGNLNRITAKGYDLYLVESNHDENEIDAKIREKKSKMEYAYELRVKRHHLSRQQCDAFLYENMKPDSVYVYMHCHEDTEKENANGEKVNFTNGTRCNRGARRLRNGKGN